MKITIYTITDCPFCKQEKDFLTSKNLQFEEKNVQQNREFLTEMLELSEKFAGVPFTVVEKDNGDKVNLKGFTQSEFEEALGLTTGAAGADGTKIGGPLDGAPKPAVGMPPVSDKAPVMPPAPGAGAPPMGSGAPVTPSAVGMPQMAGMPPKIPSSMPDPVRDMPSMPSIDTAPKNADVTKPLDIPKPISPMPSVQSIGKVSMPSPSGMPPAPGAGGQASGMTPPTPSPVTSAAPAAPAVPSTPAEPQDQLDGLLADLQSKSKPEIPDLPPQQ